MEEATARAAKQATSLRDELAASCPLDARELDELFDPAGYLGATPSFVDAALAAYRSREPKGGAHG